MARVALLVVVTLTALLGIGVPMAAAAPQMSASVTVDTPLPAPSGGDMVYHLKIQCSDLNEPDCTDVKVSIPLPSGVVDARLGTLPAGDTWSFTPGTGLSITIPSLKAGDTIDLPITMSTQNYRTPDGYSWTVEATVKSANAPSVTASAPGSVYAKADLGLRKTVDATDSVNGQPAVALDTKVRYYLNPCDPTNPGAAGSLGFDPATLVDTLPTGAQYVGSSGGGTYDKTANTVTWTTVVDGAACTDRGPFWVEVIYPSTAFGTALPLVTQVTNNATITGTPIGGSTPQSASSSVTYFFVLHPAVTPSSFDKSAIAPLEANHIPLTHPGIWGAPGGHEAQWALSASNVTNVPYTLAIDDRLPCSYPYVVGGTEQRSANVSPLAAEPVCTKPTFITQAVTVSSDFQSAVDAGWGPTWVSTSGATGAFVRVPGTLTFLPSNLPAGDDVAEVVVPRDNKVVREPGTGGAVATLDGYMRDDVTYADTPGGVPVVNSAHFQAFEGGQVAVETNQTAQINVTSVRVMLYLRKIIQSDGQVVLNGANLGDSALPGVVMTDLLPTGVTFDSSAPVSTLPAGGWDVSVIDNYAGTTRQLVRLTLKPGVQIAAGATIFGQFGTHGLSTTQRQPGTTTNTAQIGVQGAPPMWCSGAGVTYAPTYTNDPDDLDGDGLTQDTFCQSSATVKGAASAALLRAVKLVKGDLDNAYQGFPSVGSANTPGTGQFRVQVTNRGSVDLDNAVIYDVLPRVGDTGVRLAGVERGSQYNAALSAVPTVNVGPATTKIEYSQAAVPCRGEIAGTGGGVLGSFPIGCTDDWSTTAPADLSTVTALRISGLGTLAHDSTNPNVDITVPITVPSGLSAGDVAWNSFAVDAERTDTKTWLLPTEPPKVGLAVPQTDVQLTKTVNGQHTVTVPTGTVVHYKITAAHGTSVTVNPDGSVTYFNPAGSAPSTAHRVVVTDVVPAGVTIVKGSSSTSCGKDTPGGTFDEATGVWTVGDIVPGQSFSLCFDATVTGSGPLTNLAQVSATGGPTDIDSTPGNMPASGPHEDDEGDAVVTVLAPGIDLVKQVETAYQSGTWVDANVGTSEKPVYPANSPVRYRFVVTNTGQLALTGVTLADHQLGSTCPVLAQPFDLAPGESHAEICTVTAGFGVGDHVNTATVSGQPIGPSGSPVGPVLTDTDTAQITVPPTSTPTVSAQRLTTPTPGTGGGSLAFTGGAFIGTFTKVALLVIAIGVVLVLWTARRPGGRRQASRRQG